MATTYLQIANGKATGDTLAAADWNKTAASVDRGAIFSYKQQMGGVLTGWALTSGLSTLTAGEGLVGPCWCKTTVSAAISNLTTGSTNYIYAVTDGGSGASGTVDFKARTTSGTLTNYDALTSGLVLGNGRFVTASGFTSVSTRNRDSFPVYRREHTHFETAGNLVLPAMSGAHGSTIAASTTYTYLRFPNASQTDAFWPVHIRPDYTGAVTVRSYWLSRGVSNAIQWGVDRVTRGDGDTWNAGYSATGAGGQVAISGTSGKVVVLSGNWTSALPTAGDLATIRFRRYGAHGSDTQAGDARLLAVGLQYDTQL